MNLNHMTKMAAMPPNGKKPLKVFLRTIRHIALKPGMYYWQLSPGIEMMCQEQEILLWLFQLLNLLTLFESVSRP